MTRDIREAHLKAHFAVRRLESIHRLIFRRRQLYQVINGEKVQQSIGKSAYIARSYVAARSALAFHIGTLHGFQ